MMQPARPAHTQSDSQAAWSGIAPTGVCQSRKASNCADANHGCSMTCICHMSRMRMTKRRASKLASILLRAHQVSPRNAFRVAPRISTEDGTDREYWLVRNSDTDVMFPTPLRQRIVQDDPAPSAKSSLETRVQSRDEGQWWGAMSLPLKPHAQTRHIHATIMLERKSRARRRLDRNSSRFGCDDSQSSPRSRNSRRSGSGIAATPAASALPKSAGAASSARYRHPWNGRIGRGDTATTFGCITSRHRPIPSRSRNGSIATICSRAAISPRMTQ
jgi:hypothetical protein